MRATDSSRHTAFGTAFTVTTTPKLQQGKAPKILILATEACAYPGADYVGQTHSEYPLNTYIIRVPSPVLFREDFYLRCFDKGIDGIIAMSCGQECPYPGAYDRFAERIGRVHAQMKERGLDPRRLRMTAICTVCARAFLKEIHDMNAFLTATRAASSAPQ
jgi:F420-non-reducing hydrogenase iron-sulfur subunit